MKRYWTVNVSGWVNTQTVAGEEMTADEAVQMTGAKAEDCWAPVEVSREEFDAIVRFNNSKNK